MAHSLYCAVGEPGHALQGAGAWGLVADLHALCLMNASMSERLSSKTGLHSSLTDSMSGISQAWSYAVLEPEDESAAAQAQCDCS